MTTSLAPIGADCCYAECRYDECRNSAHYFGCHYAECRGTLWRRRCLADWKSANEKFDFPQFSEEKENLCYC